MPENNKIYSDPRPDLGDSERWSYFLQILSNDGPTQLALNIHGMRSQGLMFAYTKSGGYRIAPIVGPEGWDSAAAYEKVRDEYLVPYRTEFTAAINKMETMDDWKPGEIPEGIAVQQSPWPWVTGKRVYVAVNPGARRAMQELAPWAWVFHKTEIRNILNMKDQVEELCWRGQGGSLFKNDNEREAWNELDNSTGSGS